MVLESSLSLALRRIRKSRGLSQEDFSDVSSRTYMSSLERGLKSPTLKKLEELCMVMNVHPVTLLVLGYAGLELKQTEHLLGLVRDELEVFLVENN